ncbi:MAG: hypothetical protein ACOC7U_02105 [Spirochaetota bacterium]
MKVFRVVLIGLFLGTAVLAFSADVRLSENFNRTSLPPKWMPVSGNWQIINGQLVQRDTEETMAMITVPVRQSGTMLYEFDMEYVRGGEDDYAGFGFHICVNNPSKVRSWGNGQSILGWITWDPGHYGPPGAFIQVYESRGLTDMGLYERVYPSPDPLRYGDLLAIPDKYLNYEYLEYTVPFKLEVNTRTGEGKFYDPMDPDRYYYPFDLGAPIRPGSYFSFRTNSVSVRLDNLKITKLD